MKFGSISPKAATHIVFWTGLLVLLAVCIVIGWNLSTVNEMADVLRDSFYYDNSPRKVPITVHSMPLAFAFSTGLFLPSALLHRIFCELLFVKMAALKSIAKRADV